MLAVAISLLSTVIASLIGWGLFIAYQRQRKTMARGELQVLAAKPTRTALNAVALSQLAELMGDELPDVIDTYVRDTAAQIAAMEAALERSDLLGLGRSAHSLKSSSDAVGADLIQSISLALEAHARANSPLDAARPLVAALRTAFGMAAPELLAIVAAERAKSDIASVIPTGQERMPVLLAEDDEVTRVRMTRLLHNAGYEVDSAANGSAALDKMKERYYPMLVTDWEMPQMDGILLCKAVRGLSLDGYVYILLLTGRDAKDHVIIGLEAGADDYLVKPVHEAELIARLNAGRRILALEQSLRAAKEHNRILSITDALTGTFNRRYLMEQLPRELERCRRYAFPLSVLMCDLDHFKEINDQHGHAAGDDVLQQFACRARKYIRTNSDWMARSGGEEFLIVLPETGYEEAVIVAEKIRRLIAASPFATRAGDAAVTASFGIASTGPNGPDPTLNVETLIRVADEGLYKSKAAGRNRSTAQEISELALAAHG
jgi:two-component system cell cycle response regulator